jgi:hypothetical protein
MAKQWMCNARKPCITKHSRVTTLAPSAPPRPCTKFQSKYCDTCNRSFLSDKCYQNCLTVTANSKLVCECRRVCRNCSLLWLQILSLKVSRHSAISVTISSHQSFFAPSLHSSHSAISVTISSHQSVFAPSLHSSPVSFHTDSCTFCLIGNARKVLNCVMDISNSTEQHMCSASLFRVWSY